MLRENLLRIQCEIRDGIGLLRLDGELVAESRYEPERILREWLEAEVFQIVVQCDKVTHLDSAGLSILLGALHRFRRHEGDLILSQLNPGLNSILEISSMACYFKVYKDTDAALNHFREIERANKPKPGKKPARDRAQK
jgi:anti-anti-sigma factor